MTCVLKLRCEIYQVLADLEWIFHHCFYCGTRNTSNEVMIQVNRLPSIRLFYTNQVKPENHSFRHLLYALEIHDFPCPDKLVEILFFFGCLPRKPLRMVDLGLSSCFDMHRENRISGTTAPCTMIGAKSFCSLRIKVILLLVFVLIILIILNTNSDTVMIMNHYWNYHHLLHHLHHVLRHCHRHHCRKQNNSNNSPIDPAHQFLILALHKGLWVLFICPNMGESSGGFNPIWDDYREAAKVWCDWIYLTKQETKNERFIEYII